LGHFSVKKALPPIFYLIDPRKLHTCMFIDFVNIRIIEHILFNIIVWFKIYARPFIFYEIYAWDRLYLWIIINWFNVVIIDKSKGLRQGLVLTSAQITGGMGGIPPPTTYRHPWHYNSSTCVPPSLIRGIGIEKRSYFNANPPLYFFANSSTSPNILNVSMPLQF